MISIQTESAWKGTSDCRNCAIRDTALFADLTEADFQQIHAPIDDLALRANATLYAESQPALGVFTLRSGMLKLVRSTPDGRQRIVRVLRAGDVAGLEALASAHYNCDAVALTDATVCRIPLSVMHHLAANSPRMHKRLMEKWQHALKEADDWLADLNFGSARQRVAHLVLKMRSPDDMTHCTLFAREDMGAMLDLKLETVSREVSALVRDQLIAPLDKQGRSYRILNLAQLQAV